MIELNDTQKEFQSAVARFAAEEITPNATAWDAQDEFPMHLFAQLGALGWLGVGTPEVLGGSGGGAVERCLLIEELTKASAGVALGIYVNTALAGGALAEVAEPRLRDQFLPGILSGEITGAWAYAEPDAGADVTQARLSARRDGDGFVLNGTKMYITNGTFAEVIMVVARTGQEPGRLRGLSVFAVDGNTPGLTRTKMAKVGMRPSELAELHFAEVRVPVDRMLGDEETGFRQCLPVLSRGRIFGGAMGIGLSGAALNASAEHVVHRKQFGGALVELQDVRFNLAKMTTRLRAARGLVYDAAQALDEGRDFDTDASIAKLFASETATWIVERAMHLHGAQGFMLESPVQRFYRDCKILEYGEGASEVHREMIAKALILGYRP